MKRAILRALLAFLLVQILALAAGLTAAALLGSTTIGFVVSNVGAIVAVLIAIKVFVMNR